MINKIRLTTRKHKILYYILKKIYNFGKSIVYFPKKLILTFKSTKKLTNMKKTKDRKIWYICVPTHPNLGDQAQAICIRKWFLENYSDYKIIELPSLPIYLNWFGYIKKLKKLVEKNDLIFFQSGYTSTNLHKDEEVHRKIVSEFKNNKIIFFPQTVNYTSEKEKLKTAKIYNSHGNIVFIARDNKSFNVASKIFTNIKVLKYPDIVTLLIGKYKFDKKRNGILFCLRNDGEKLYTDTQINNLKSSLKNISKIDTTDTTIIANKDNNYEKELLKILNKFSEYEIIITDRFHGTIFSLITSTPVIVIATNDFKVSEGAKWFLDVYKNYIFYEQELNRVKVIVKKVLSSNHDYLIKECFGDKYFNELKFIIEEYKNANL